jgi:dephospho-CoA kinase
MIVVGLTGGIGMGKSAAADLLRERGLPVVDTDLIARQLAEPGQPALVEIKNAFGPEIIAPDGRLRRDELARRVFASAPALKKLEDILHPRIRTIWMAQIESWRAEGRPLAVVVIPLLFETNAAALFDRIICAACSASTQRQRLQARGWDANQMERRVAAQWPVEKKMDLADYVVWTEAGLDVHAGQLERILSQLNNFQQFRG